MRKAGLAALVATIAAALAADQVVLHDGGKIKGKIVSYDGKTVLLETEKGKRKIDWPAVKRLVFEKAAEKSATEKPTRAVPKDVQKILEAAREAARRYPQKKYVVLIDEGKEIVEESGRRINEYHAAVLILKREALRFANRAMWFEPGRSTAEVLAARTIKPDGTVIEMDPSSVKEQSRAQSASFYDYGKLLVYTIPGVEVGSVVEYRTRWVNERPYDPNIFSFEWHFGWEQPYMWSYYEVEVPNKVTLHHKLYNAPKVTFQKLPGRRTTRYIWEMRDWPGVEPEPRMIALGDVVPKVCISPFAEGDWTYLNNWYTKRLKHNMRVTEALKKTAGEATKGAKDDEDAVRKLYHWVQRNVRYVSVKRSIMSGLCGHPAAETLERKTGDCIDCAVAFCALVAALENPRVKAYPVGVLTNDEGMPEKDLPNFLGNHAIVEVNIEGKKPFLLDPTGSDYRYPSRWSASHDTWIHNPVLGKVYRSELPPPEADLNDFKARLSLKEDGSAEFERTISGTGEEEAWIRGVTRHNRPDVLDRWAEQVVNHYAPGGTLKENKWSDPDDFDTPMWWRIKAHLPAYANRSGSFMLFRIPGLGYRFREVATQSRKFAIQYGTTYCERHKVVIELPAGWRVYRLPPKLELKTPQAAYRAEAKVEAGKVIFEDEFRRTARFVQPKDYPAYRDLLRRVAEYSQQRIFLVREEKSEGEKK